MNLHPYDGVERRFRHTDAFHGEGLRLVAQLLRLPAPPAVERVLYDLSFYSGGIGILDSLAITLEASPQIWDSVVQGLSASTLEETAADAAWAQELAWLMTGEDEPVASREAAEQFFNQEKRDFQSVCDAASRILFVEGSGVNSWGILWGDDRTLNYRGHDQG